MNNFEQYISKLKQEKFVESMILNCDGCPAYPCRPDVSVLDGWSCWQKLEEWCEKPAKEKGE